jgi:hypothetical protein
MGPAVLATIDLPFKIHNKQPPHPRSQADPYTKFCGLVVSIGRRNSKSRLTEEQKQKIPSFTGGENGNGMANINVLNLIDWIGYLFVFCF